MSRLPEYLSKNYPLEEIEGWKLFKRHMDLNEGFALVLLTAADNWGVEYVRNETSRSFKVGETLLHFSVDDSISKGALAEFLLGVARCSDSNPHLIWIASDPEESVSNENLEDIWQNELAILNRFRNRISEGLNCTVVIAGPRNLLAWIRENAPDLWSIRSGVFRMEPVTYQESLELTTEYT
jgi:hypothetical protein